MGDLDAIGRLIKFCNEWDKMRMKGDDIHGLHMGDEREAFLCASDIRQAADEIARLREEVKRLREPTPAMIAAGQAACEWVKDEEAATVYRAMIDAADDEGR